MRQIHNINFIISPIDDTCNLNCKYCNVKKIYNKNKINHSRLDINIFEKLLIDLLECDLINIAFTWHGGEPTLLSNNYYNNIINLQKKYLTDNINYVNIIQTNGTLLNECKIDFFIKNNFFIGISIDGIDYETNKDRFFGKYKKYFVKLKNNIKMAKHKNLDFSIAITLNNNTINHPELIFNFIKSINPKNGVLFNPLFLNNNNQISNNTIKSNDFYNFMVKIYNLQKEQNFYFENNIIKNINLGLEQKLPNLCFLCDRCINFLNFGSNGNLYSTCQPNKKYFIGNIKDESFKNLLIKHIHNNENINSIFKNKRICEELDNEKFIYFIGKGCINKMINNKDYYLEFYKNYIQYIHNNNFISKLTE